MLHWLPNVLPKKDPLFFRLLIFVFTYHSVLIVGYAVWARPKPLVVHLSRGLIVGDRVIRVLPFVRSTGQLNRVFDQTHKSHTSGSGFSAAGRANKKLRIIRSSRAKTGVEYGEKISGKKIKNHKAVVQKTQKIMLKKNKKGQKNGVNVNVKLVESVVAVSAVADVKKLDTQAPEKKHALIKSEPVVSKKEIVDEIASEELESTVSEVENESLVQEGPLDVEAVASSDDQSPVELGQEEFEILQTYRAIHEQMSEQWHPPVGLHPAKHCIILVTINLQGAGAQLQVEQSSGVLAYDIAARMAVSRAKFPKSVWNQQVRLHF